MLKKMIEIFSGILLLLIAFSIYKGYLNDKMFFVLLLIILVAFLLALLLSFPIAIHVHHYLNKDKMNNRQITDYFAFSRENEVKRLQ